MRKQNVLIGILVLVIVLIASLLYKHTQDKQINTAPIAVVAPAISPAQALVLVKTKGLAFVAKQFNETSACMYYQEDNNHPYIYSFFEHHVGNCVGDPNTEPHITDITVDQNTGALSYSMYDGSVGDFVNKPIVN